MFAPYAAGSGISEIKCIIGKIEAVQKTVHPSNSTITFSWIRNEGIFGWLDFSDEKYRFGKTKEL